jgi:hypothetical protein
LSTADAAAYCGLKVRAFKRNIPLPPVKIGSAELWDRNALDAYIDGLQGSAPTAKPVDWVARAADF